MVAAAAVVVGAEVEVVAVAVANTGFAHYRRQCGPRGLDQFVLNELLVELADDRESGCETGQAAAGRTVESDMDQGHCRLRLPRVVMVSANRSFAPIANQS